MYYILTFLLQDPVSEIKKIANFLGKECSDKFAEEVAEKCNIENVRKAEEQIRRNEHGFIYRKGNYNHLNNHFSMPIHKTFLLSCTHYFGASKN